ncbi:MAG: Phospho-N-acetylmuramoyl-pentapeptide-transferase [Candidatus Giovannonibacteria bacterium GW2011_GWA2_53_7]|uniref:Phospho-N-acetylmuramoyl-pentapeptide-transferase n=1 Tax=Candidatus Giovannonibacteria bacterium GW2011_GWA2_53_7 TaxID=1618650 RepID=A0A0G1Y0K8_9BACT|nr:MAG: Phospho-N-acetylmuramoyl-pentapeptide-transferase [Candidatus Giovannonibacteria bacterium GW2011_GWA2_53_7]
MTLESFEIIRLLILTTIAFAVAFFSAPPLIRFLHAAKMGKSIRSAAETPVYSKLHAKKNGTPTMGGIVVWLTVLLLAFVFAAFYQWSPESFLGKLNFLTRPQTLLPLGALVASAIVGLVDDYWNIKKIGPSGGGLRVRHRLLIYAAVAAFGAWWFSAKLGFDLLHVPFMGDFVIGPWWYALFFLVVIVATAFSVNETDGLDGLAGGTLFIAFGAYAIIAFAQGKYDLAVFCGVIIGALLAFLWFNIHPARFFLGDTGAMSLGVTLGIVAMLTNAALLLPIIGFVFVLESSSVLLQLWWRRVFKKKLLRSSPLHHHLEAKGWPEPQIVMRLWVVSIVVAAIGVAISLMDALIKNVK